MMDEVRQVGGFVIKIKHVAPQHYALIMPGEIALSQFINACTLMQHGAFTAYSDIVNNTLITAKAHDKVLHYFSVADRDSQVREVMEEHLRAFACAKVETNPIQRRRAAV